MIEMMARNTLSQLYHPNRSPKHIIPTNTVTIEHITTEVVPTAMRFLPTRRADNQNSVLAMKNTIGVIGSPKDGQSTHRFEKYPPKPNISAERNNHRNIMETPLLSISFGNLILKQN